MLVGRIPFSCISEWPDGRPSHEAVGIYSLELQAEVGDEEFAEPNLEKPGLTFISAIDPAIPRRSQTFEPALRMSVNLFIISGSWPRSLAS